MENKNRMKKIWKETGIPIGVQMFMRRRGYEIKKLQQFDLLKAMLDMQDKLQNRFNMHPPLKDIASAIISEGDELWKADGGKWWSNKIYTREEKAEELIDILHFWLAACINVGLSAEEIFDIYSKKLAENYKRQFQKGGYKG